MLVIKKKCRRDSEHSLSLNFLKYLLFIHYIQVQIMYSHALGRYKVALVLPWQSGE